MTFCSDEPSMIRNPHKSRSVNRKWGNKNPLGTMPCTIGGGGINFGGIYCLMLSKVSSVEKICKPIHIDTAVNLIYQCSVNALLHYYFWETDIPCLIHTQFCCNNSQTVCMFLILPTNLHSHSHILLLPAQCLYNINHFPFLGAASNPEGWRNYTYMDSGMTWRKCGSDMCALQRMWPVRITGWVDGLVNV